MRLLLLLVLSGTLKIAHGGEVTDFGGRMV